MIRQEKLSAFLNLDELRYCAALQENIRFNCGEHSTFHSCSFRGPIISSHDACLSNPSPSLDKTIFSRNPITRMRSPNIWNATVFKDSKNSYHSLVHNLGLPFGAERSGVARSNIFLRQGVHAGKTDAIPNVFLCIFFRNIITVYEEFVSQNRDFWT